MQQCMLGDEGGRAELEATKKRRLMQAGQSGPAEVAKASADGEEMDAEQAIGAPMEEDKTVAAPAGSGASSATPDQ